MSLSEANRSLIWANRRLEIVQLVKVVHSRAEEFLRAKSETLDETLNSC